MPPGISLYEYDGNPDIIVGNELTANETGWTELSYMVYIVVNVPDGAVSVQTYYAEAGSEAKPHIMLDNKYSSPIKKPADIEQLTTGNSFRAEDYFPDGFLGHIWAVATDANGKEYSSNIVNVIWD